MVCGKLNCKQRVALGLLVILLFGALLLEIIVMRDMVSRDNGTKFKKYQLAFIIVFLIVGSGLTFVKGYSVFNVLQKRLNDLAKDISRCNNTVPESDFSKVTIERSLRYATVTRGELWLKMYSTPAKELATFASLHAFGVVTAGNDWWSIVAFSVGLSGRAAVDVIFAVAFEEPQDENNVDVVPDAHRNARRSENVDIIIPDVNQTVVHDPADVQPFPPEELTARMGAQNKKRQSQDDIQPAAPSQDSPDKMDANHTVNILASFQGRPAINGTLTVCSFFAWRDSNRHQMPFRIIVETTLGKLQIDAWATSDKIPMFFPEDNQFKPCRFSALRELMENSGNCYLHMSFADNIFQVWSHSSFILDTNLAFINVTDGIRSADSKISIV
jgi:hypothetical protein